MNNGDPLIWQLLLLFSLILISGFFSCAEIALSSINKNKLEKAAGTEKSESPGSSGKISRQARRILSLTGEPSKFLATIQVGSILAGFMASAFAAHTISGRASAAILALGLAMGRTLPQATVAGISMVLITIVLVFFQIVFGELVPKRLAMKYADTLAFRLSLPVVIISRIFSPLVLLLSKSTNGILRLLGVNPQGETHAVTEEEIRLMIDVGNARGTIDQGEKEILHNVFEFDHKTTGEVMTHRRDTVLLKMEESDEAWEETITQKTHNYYPICGETQDNIIGVLKTKDYLCLKDRTRDLVLARAVSPPQLVPIMVKINVLFGRMKKNRNHFAVVLDEHGSFMGVVTMKDLLEELVGDLDDDSSRAPDEPLIQKTGEETWTINGAVSLDKVAQELGVPLPTERYDTFAGYVFSVLGRIPEDGSHLELDTQELRISILDVRERRLEKALVNRR